MKIIWSTSSGIGCQECTLSTSGGKRLKFVGKRSILPGNSYVQELLTLDIGGVKLVWCFRRCGTLQLYRLSEECEEGYTKVIEIPRCGNDSTDFCIFLKEFGGIVYCCTNKGRLTLVNMNQMYQSYDEHNCDLKLPIHVLQLSEPLSSFAVDPQDQWTVLCGGYGNHLQVYKLITPFNDRALTNNELFKILNYSAIHKVLPMWMLKTNKKSKREFEEFPWITAILFAGSEDEDDLHGNRHKICCVTQFGKISFYDSSISGHSIKEMTVSNHRIRVLQRLLNKDLIFVDSFGYIGIMRDDNLLYHYRLQNFGPLSGVDILEIDNTKYRDEEEASDDDDDDLLQLAARRQSHFIQFKKHRPVILNDIYVIYTTVIGELKMVKLNLQDNGVETISGVKLNNKGGNNIACLKHVFNTAQGPGPKQNDEFEIFHKLKNSEPSTDFLKNSYNKQQTSKKRHRYRINSYI